MATIFNTATDLTPASVEDPDVRLWVYNGLDCCATGKIRAHPDIVAGLARDGHRLPYKFVRAMQGPALDIMLRGVCVNPLERMRTMKQLKGLREKQEALLNQLARAVWGRDLNPNSPKQLQCFFYLALKMPEQYALRKTPQGKVRTLSCDHSALESLAKHETKGPGIDPYDRNVSKVRLAAPFVKLILNIREYDKKITTVSQFGERFKFSVNVVGTKTGGRWSTSSNAFGEGGNAQNITEEMRRPLCADPGMKLYNVDLKQAESRQVGALVWQCTGDDTYWKACESDDLHTVVCIMAWPETFKQYPTVAEAKKHASRKGGWYRHLSHRDGAKRIGHGSNYWGTAYGIAMQIGDIEVRVVRDFQTRYFTAFPAIPKWHAHLIRELQTNNELWTCFGRRRIFFGRTYDDNVIREAMAHVPQSSNGELLNLMLYKVWRYGIDGGTITLADGRVLPFRPNCQLLLQVHDSFVWQSPDDPLIEAAVIAKVLELTDINIPIRRGDEVRTLNVPLEVQCGWNWAKKDDKKELFADGNPDGITEWDGPGSDARVRQNPAKPALSEWLD